MLLSSVLRKSGTQYFDPCLKKMTFLLEVLSCAGIHNLQFCWRLKGCAKNLLCLVIEFEQKPPDIHKKLFQCTTMKKFKIYL